MKFPEGEEKTMGIDEDPFPSVNEVSIRMNSISVPGHIGTLVNETENLPALAKKAMKDQHPDPKILKHVCIRCGEEYVNMCEMARF